MFLTYDQNKRPNAKEIKDRFDKILSNNKIQINPPIKKHINEIPIVKELLKIEEWELIILCGNKALYKLLSEQIQSINIKYELVNLYRTISMGYFRLNYFNKVTEYILEAIKINTLIFSSKDSQLIEDYYNLGFNYFYIRDYSNAIKSLKKGLSLCTQFYGYNNSKTFDFHALIAKSYAATNEKAKMIKYCTKLEEGLTKIENKKYKQVWDIYNELGEIYNEFKDYKKSIYYFKKALDLPHIIREKGLRYITISFSNLGKAYSNMNEYTQAVDWYLNALSTATKTKDFREIEISRIYDELAKTYYQIEDYQTAIEYYLKSEMIVKKIIGANAFAVGSINYYICMCYYAIRDYYIAIEYFERAMKIYTYYIRGDCDYFISLYLGYGDLYETISNISKALELYKKAEDIAVLNKKNELTLTRIYKPIFVIYIKQNRNDLAYEYYMKSLKLISGNSNKLSVNYIETLYMEMVLHKYKKEYESVTETFNKIEACIKNDPSIIPKDIGFYYFFYALFQCDVKKDFAATIKYLLQSLDKLKPIYTDKYPNIDCIYFQLGMAYKDNKEYKNAEQVFLKIISINKMYSNENELLGKTHFNLGEVYFDLGKYDLVIKHYQSAIDFNSKYPNLSN